MFISVLKTCFVFLFCYYLINALVNAVSTLQSAHESVALQMRDDQASDVRVSIYESAFKFAFLTMMQTININSLTLTRFTLILIIFTKLDCKDDQFNETSLYSQNVRFENN